MRDKSGAHHVAPDGSRLAILPTTSGGTATLPRAPGQDRPRPASSGAARPDRPRATPGRRIRTYPRPLWPGCRVLIVRAPRRACRFLTGFARCKRRRVMGDPPARLPACRGMTVRAPPPGHRVPTYPRPRRPGRRVSTVCVPRNGRQITSDPAPRQRRRVMADPPARFPACRGLTVRAPPSGRRIRTHPRPLWPGRRVLIVCAPWPPPWRRLTAPVSRTRWQVPIAPIADPLPDHA